MVSEKSRLEVIGKLKWAGLFNGAIVLIQAAGAFFSNSLGLWSDAGHNFTDTAGLFLSYFALRQTLKSPTATRTYGYHRSGTLAAFLNAISLAMMTLVIFYQAWHRFLNPEPVNGVLMYGIAAFAFSGNGLIALSFRKIRKTEINAKTAFLHMAGDAMVSLGVIVAGLVVTYTGWLHIDALIGALIGGVILYGTVPVLRESVGVLMEGAPPEIPADQVIRTISGVSEVLEILDLHIWTVGSESHILSCRILVSELSPEKSRRVRQAIRTLVTERHGIAHLTIELETAPLPVGGEKCSLTS